MEISIKKATVGYRLLLLPGLLHSTCLGMLWGKLLILFSFAQIPLDGTRIGLNRTDSDMVGYG